MASDTSVLNMLIDTVSEALLKSCRSILDASDKTRAGLVKPGLLQDDPLKFGITVLTLANDPYHPGTWHHQLAKEGPGNSGMVPSLETGGPDELWFRPIYHSYSNVLASHNVPARRPNQCQYRFISM